jgi:hypothetical protein
VSAVGTCPAYLPFGISTRKRPDAHHESHSISTVDPAGASSQAAGR